MNRALQLIGGHHAGPLFVIQKRRAPSNDNRGPARVKRVRRRTPAWADADAMRCLYKLASIYSRATGVQYSVDHVVPLHHPLVSGLHCEANLRVIPLDDNRRKSNREWPDMPEQQAALF